MNKVEQSIAKRKATKATGARVGVKMVAPVTKRKYTKSTKTAEQKALKAKKQREYRASLTPEQKRAAQDKSTARQRMRRKGQAYMYYPSIAQARDVRHSGALLEEHYQTVTAIIAVSDVHLDFVAHDEAERAIDEALQIARRPQSHRQPWEVFQYAERESILYWYDESLPTWDAGAIDDIPQLIVQPHRILDGLRIQYR